MRASPGQPEADLLRSVQRYAAVGLNIIGAYWFRSSRSEPSKSHQTVRRQCHAKVYMHNTHPSYTTTTSSVQREDLPLRSHPSPSPCAVGTPPHNPMATATSRSQGWQPPHCAASQGSPAATRSSRVASSSALSSPLTPWTTRLWKALRCSGVSPAKPKRTLRPLSASPVTLAS